VVVKLLDFGVAKIKGDPVRGSKTSDLTESGSILGSPLFMSPEQLQDMKTLDYRTDIWSLGVVLYCALAGRAPHEDIKNFAVLIIALCEGHPPPIHQSASWVPLLIALVAGVGAIALSRFTADVPVSLEHSDNEFIESPYASEALRDKLREARAHFDNGK